MDIYTQLCETVLRDLKDKDDEFSKDMEGVFKSYLVQLVYIIEVLEKRIPNKYSDNQELVGLTCRNLILDSVNTFLSGIILTTMGHFREPSILFRNCVEVIASSIDLYLHPEKYDTFMSGSHKSTKSISVFDSIMPDDQKYGNYIGKTYALLSRDSVHMNIMDFFPPNFDKESCFINGVNNYSDFESWRKYHLILNADSIFQILQMGFEYIYFDFLGEANNWANHDGKTVFAPKIHPDHMRRLSKWRTMFKDGFQDKFGFDM